MVPFFIFIILIVVLDLTALRWGFDSTEVFSSPEWERKKHWNAFH